METSVFILKHPATKNTKLDQSLNRTNFSSGNQKAKQRVKKVAPLIRQRVLLKLSQGGIHWHQPGSQFCCYVRYITHITRNRPPNIVTACLQHIHSAYNYVTEENNQKSFGFGVLILAPVRKGTSTVVTAISFWGHNQSVPTDNYHFPTLQSSYWIQCTWTVLSLQITLCTWQSTKIYHSPQMTDKTEWVVSMPH